MFVNRSELTCKPHEDVQLQVAAVRSSVRSGTRAQQRRGGREYTTKLPENKGFPVLDGPTPRHRLQASLLPRSTYFADAIIVRLRDIQV